MNFIIPTDELICFGGVSSNHQPAIEIKAMDPMLLDGGFPAIGHIFKAMSFKSIGNWTLMANWNITMFKFSKSS